MNHIIDAQTYMLAHSKAKVELYKKYLAVYLNVLSNVRTINNINIFDLLCGEGIYEDGTQGSPLVALDVIRHHYFSHGETCPNIDIWFNDKGESKIERGVYKIDRVRKLCEQKFKPKNITINYSRKDYEIAFQQALAVTQKAVQTKSLFFIDPYGYKIAKPMDIRDALECGNVEVILFLPISHMYRFAEKSLHSPFSGSEPLSSFITELFGQTIPQFTSAYDFIVQTKERFRNYLSNTGAYVDTFTLERDKQNLYCLYFFTTHIRGFEKMLEVKWSMDIEQGRGFKLEQTGNLFSAIELSDYPTQLQNFLLSANHRTNKELYSFGLEHGFLPKHTNEVLRSWGDAINIISMDSKPAKGTYIDYDTERSVGIQYLNLRLPL